MLSQGQCNQHEFDNAFRLFVMSEQNGLTPVDLVRYAKLEGLTQRGIKCTIVAYTTLI